MERRWPKFAGTFYPNDPYILRNEIEGYLEKAKVPDEIKDKEIFGIIAPHAGYIYSGQVAAYAYKPIKGRSYDVVVVLAPSHRTYFKGVSIYNSGRFVTPLGEIEIDEKTSKLMESLSDAVKFYPEAHTYEHSLEVQLPFLQVALSEFLLVPIVFGSQDLETCKNLADTLEKALDGKNFLICASSDLSHYYPYEKAKKMDSKVVELVERADCETLYELFSKGVCEACGQGPILSLILFSKKLSGSSIRVLNYATSGDVSGDKGAVVGYMSAVFFKK